MSPRVAITAQQVRKASDTRVHPLGTIGETPDGRVYRYAKGGAADLTAGNLLVNADLVANHTNRTVNGSPVAGTKEVVVNIGNTAITADQYQDGYLVVNDAAGEGIAYPIEGNTAASGSGTPTIFLKTPLVGALTDATSEVTLKLNNFDSVVISATDQADLPVGVSNIAIDVSEKPYFWLQTRGECSVLADEAVTKGQALTIGTGTAGAVEALDAAGEPQVGIASEALVDTENRSAYLTLD